MSLIEVLDAIDDTLFYRIGLVFYGFYPMAMAFVWIVMSAVYFHRRERRSPELAPPDYLPFVSIVIPAFDEEATIGKTLDALLNLDYPDYEVIVVDDGSTDTTADVVTRDLSSGRVRLVQKQINEGKAMALNDALPVCRGEILLFLDSDIVATPSLLRTLVPHFAAPRVGAVTGNPRVANRGSLLRDLQALEFTSIISVQRRAQRIWGRVLTASGAVMAVRKTALVELGGFAPEMATEDIDLTWKLQRRLWDVRYEPAAVVWMQVPPTLTELWKQRRRWARGLAQVLIRHRSLLKSWRERRLWPVFFEAALSILWAYTFLFMSVYWVASHLASYAPLGASPIPNIWGMMIATACLTQLLAGVLMDRRYDPGLGKRFAVAIFYPLIYWMLMSLITSIYTIDAFIRKPPKTQRWKIGRSAAAVLVVLLAATPARGQTVREWIERGHVAAAADRHVEAIAAWERAIELDPSVRRDLLVGLGRQWLWSDEPERAAGLLAEALASGESSCGARNDYGLALAWSDRLREAAAVYERVIDECPGVRNDARLRLALVERWLDRPSAAESAYARVLHEGDEAQRNEAAAGMAHVALMRGHERSALGIFERLPTPAAAEGAALALFRLGEVRESRDRIAGWDGELTRDLRRLDRRIAAFDRPQAEGGALLFDDADGTRFSELRLGASTGWRLRGRGGVALARWRLENGREDIRANRVVATAEHRFDPGVAVVANLALSDYHDLGWRPLTGEVRLVLTPGDRTRWDLSAARLLVPDNVEATLNELEGTYLSIGVDREVIDGVTVTLGADWTDWSTGNQRTRLYGGPRWQMEGVPRVTIEWPTLLMRYDEGFSFGLFSPKEYVETGPGVNVYRRFSPHWSASLYARGGWQKESGRSWDPVGTVRALVEREILDDWALRASVGWSNSNLASGSGFRRTSVSIDLVRRF